ncbi:acyl carrier protein [Ascidiimonas sp. W6]|uniref:acyl carrier protein n=1 Tax=Ascidiimonas meishanensis TaxID=3128903 RepID=UPI0030ECAE80
MKAKDIKEIENQLTGIWKEVLKIDKINPEQNFFDLGGDSIAAMTLARLIKRNFQIKVPTVKIFSYPNIKKQSVWIYEKQEISLKGFDEKMDQVNSQLDKILKKDNN